ncbi:MAG: hypothetical protein JSS82_16335 [Bacteroidetes bacterium]|nr:hypothetical protein [Bacteroidota bacterium]
MKIRIKGDSIRIRLTKSEVDKFGSEGHIEETTHFSDGAFSYMLESSEKVHELSASFIDGKISMLVPVAMQQEWVNTDIVGFKNNIDIGDGKTLFLLLEKDFKCIDGEVLEDQSDNYENPLATCQ